MSEPVHVAVICEGLTERIFVDTILAPHFHDFGVYMNPMILTKKGENGGDVKYNRLYSDLELRLKQSHYRCITTLFDFYGLADFWPGYDEAKKMRSPAEKQATISDAVKAAVDKKLEHLRSYDRFLPNFVMHEIEALYFSCPEIVATKLGVDIARVQAILRECGEPEAINHMRDNSPSHRLSALGNFHKISTGIAIAHEIGLPRIRAACPLFDQWIGRIEALAGI